MKGVLPQSWIIEDVFLDYGTDLRVQIVRDGEPTGLLFFIQIKAHEHALVNQSEILEDVDVGHIRYYLRLPIPVFLVVYDRARKDAFYQDIRRYVEERLVYETPGWELQRTVRVHLPISSTLQDAHAHAQIEAVVRDFFQRHGLIETAPLSDPIQRFSGYVLLKFASAYPSKRLYAKVIGETLAFLKLRRRTQIDEKRVRANLDSLVEYEESPGGRLVTLSRVSHAKLAAASNFVTDENLVAFMTSPWALSIKDSYFRAFLVIARLRRKGKLTSAISSILRIDRDLYFTLLQELLLLEPEALLAVRGVILESVIKSSGEHVVRSTSFRFADAEPNQAFEEFATQAEKPEWTEIVTTSTHAALVRLRVVDVEKTGHARTLVLESSARGAKFVFEIVETGRGQGGSVTLLGISAIQKRGPDQVPLMSVFSQARDFHFRGGLLDSLVIVGGQQVSLQPMSIPTGPGVRFVVDGVPVFEASVSSDLQSMPLPPEVLEAMARARAHPKLRSVVVVVRKLDVSTEEREQAIGEIILRLRERYPNLMVQ